MFLKTNYLLWYRPIYNLYTHVLLLQVYFKKEFKKFTKIYATVPSYKSFKHFKGKLLSWYQMKNCLIQCSIFFNIFFWIIKKHSCKLNPWQELSHFGLFNNITEQYLFRQKLIFNGLWSYRHLVLFNFLIKHFLMEINVGTFT